MNFAVRIDSIGWRMEEEEGYNRLTNLIWNFSQATIMSLSSSYVRLFFPPLVSVYNAVLLHHQTTSNIDIYDIEIILYEILFASVSTIGYGLDLSVIHYKYVDGDYFPHKVQL